MAQYFHPDTAATGQLMTDLAVGLQERGLDLTVYTTQPNYHSGDFDRQSYQEIYEGVDVRRIRAPQFKQTSLPRRAFNWAIYTVWMALVLLLSRSVSNREVVFVSNPPFFPLAIWTVCRLRGLSYTYIVHDLWPEKGVEFGFWSEGGIVDRIWSSVHARVFQDADAVITLGPKMREGILSYKVGHALDESVTVIHNWADGKSVKPCEKEDNWFSEENDLVEEFTLLYSGNLGLFHDVETPIRGVAACEEDVKLIVIGEGDARDYLLNVAETLGILGDRVEFLPYQPRENLPYSLTCADVAVVSVGEGFEGTCVSSKLYTALATGQPVLVVASEDADEARIVTDNNAGQQVVQGDIEGVVEAIRRWRENPGLLDRQGKNARNLFERRFAKEHAIDQYYQVLVGETPAVTDTTDSGEASA